MSSVLRMMTLMEYQLVGHPCVDLQGVIPEMSQLHQPSGKIVLRRTL